MKNRFANTVVVDSQKNEIRIDGVPFPYWVAPDPEIEVIADGAPAVLHIGIYADNLTYVSQEGEHKVIAAADITTELAWARERAKDIVLDGLRDVVEWLGECELERQRRESGTTAGSL
jgi:hypothetical protein